MNSSMVTKFIAPIVCLILAWCLKVLSSNIDTLNSNLQALEKKITEVENSFETSDIRIGELELKDSELEGKITILDGSANIEFRRKSRIGKVKTLVISILAEERLPASDQLSDLEIAEIATSLVDSCDKYNVPVYLMLGLIRQESAFNPLAQSEKDAKGLAQVIDTTAEDISELLGFTGYNPHKISHSIRFGTYYLSRMLKKFNYDNQKALWAYNAGPTAVSRFINGGIKSLPAETIDYEIKVQTFAAKYKARGVY